MIVIRQPKQLRYRDFFNGELKHKNHISVYIAEAVGNLLRSIRG